MVTLHLENTALKNIYDKNDYFQFGFYPKKITGLIFIKKNNQIEFFLKKKPKPGQSDRFRFGF